MEKRDYTLPIPRPPSFDSLLEFLCRRLVPTDSLRLIKTVLKLVLNVVLSLIGFKHAQKRLEENHVHDPRKCCWYCPAECGDRFGIRPDEEYFSLKSTPSQPLTSYSVLIKGNKIAPATCVEDGLAIYNKVDNNNTTTVHSIRKRDIDRDSNTNPKEYSLNLITSPGLVKETEHKDITPMILRATSLVLALLEVRKSILNDEIQQDCYKGQSQTMQWYNYVFSSGLVLHGGCIERYRAPSVYSHHIMVLIGGAMYQVELLRCNTVGEERMPSFAEIQHQFERIVQQVKQSTNKNLFINVLSTLPPAIQSCEYQRLRATSDTNRSHLAALRDALFVVCLDCSDEPQETNDAMYSLHSRNFANRWYDKSLQLVVFRNGMAGFVLNFLAGMTGGVCMKIMKMVKEREQQVMKRIADVDYGDLKLSDITPPRLLIWNDTPNSYFASRIKVILNHSQTRGPFLPLLPRIFKLSCGVTRQRFVSSRVSPGGAFNAALHLTLANTSGHVNDVYEIVSVRHFRFGGHCWLPTNTADMTQFVTQTIRWRDITSREHKALNQCEKPNLKRLLVRALTTYREDVLRCKAGEMSLWHLDALYRLLGLTTRLPSPSHQVSKRLVTSVRQWLTDLLRCPKINLLPAQTPQNMLSNPGWVDCVEAVGRPGVRSLVPHNGLALHYIYTEDAIGVSLNPNTDHPCFGNEHQFVKKLEQNLRFVAKLITTPA